jgi:hypothetical protein
MGAVPLKGPHLPSGIASPDQRRRKRDPLRSRQRDRAGGFQKPRVGRYLGFAGKCMARLFEGSGVMKIEIEGETPDEWSMFRLTLNGKLIAESLTAAQAHLLVGEIFEKALLPGKKTLQASPHQTATIVKINPRVA